MRKPVIKAQYDSKIINALQKNLIRQKQTFELTLSTYTTRFSLKDVEFVFMLECINESCFSAYHKVKTDVINKPMPKVHQRDIVYFCSNVVPMKRPVIYATDIKSAYANILFNDGYLTLDTFSYLQTVRKPDRLASIGMLAGHKTTYFFTKGKCKGSADDFSSNSDYFFYCVKRTNSIMNDCRRAIGNDFVLTWVDCIYYKSEESRKEIERVLRDNNLGFSHFELYDFEAIDKGADCLVRYKKEGCNTYFFIPKYKLSKHGKLLQVQNS